MLFFARHILSTINQPALAGIDELLIATVMGSACVTSSSNSTVALEGACS